MDRTTRRLLVAAVVLLLLGGAVGVVINKVAVPKIQEAIAKANQAFKPPDPAHPEIVGIGAQLRMDDDGALKITQALPNSPASRAGLTAGLVILKIDNESTEGLNLKTCVDRIRGPLNSKVRIEVYNPVADRTNTIELIRQKIQT
jgi:C-terminal processing protease CtpA/Prc